VLNRKLADARRADDLPDLNVSTKPSSKKKSVTKKKESAVLKPEKSQKITHSSTSTSDDKIPAEPKPAPIDVEKLHRKVAFEPNPGPQTEFLAASEQEVLYGGAAGGGKSFSMVADPVRYFNNPQFRGLLLRRSTEELRELVNISNELYPKFDKRMKWSERKSTWTAPSGATLWMSYLDRDEDAIRYQGQSYGWIGFDELTQWATSYPWNYLRSRNRTSRDSGLPTFMRATTNPGGPGHAWVKEMFVDPAPAGEAFWATDEAGNVIKYPDGHAKAGQPLFKRRFIPAKLFDNPYIAEDGMYEANLLSLPEHQRRQLLEGDWSIAEGAAFTEFNPRIHVVEPFSIPGDWVKFRAADYGYSSHSAVLWFAVHPSGQLIVYRELYVSKATAVDLAYLVLDAESGEKVRYGVLDSSVWHKRGDPGPSLAEQMIIRGCHWRPSDRSKGSRVAGKNEIHRLLQVDEFSGEPGIVIFNNCRNLIKQLPSIPLDKNNQEDIDTKSEDHLYDALRYGVMTRPKTHLFDFSPELSGGGYQPADPTMGY
jgi:hypothetical protein